MVEYLSVKYLLCYVFFITAPINRKQMIIFYIESFFFLRYRKGKYGSDDNDSENEMDAYQRPTTSMRNRRGSYDDEENKENKLRSKSPGVFSIAD